MHMVMRSMWMGVLLLACAAAQAQIARVAEVRGTVLAERSGTAPRILGPGEVLASQDVVGVARDSHAILEFGDGSRATLRPHSVLRLAGYRSGQPQNLLYGLRKGGLRMQGASAVAFDARLCGDDCAGEEKLRPPPAGRTELVARVVEMKGRAAAAGPRGNNRLLVTGAAILEHEDIATGPRSYVVLAFRDGARITLAESSRLSIRRFFYDPLAPWQGSAFLALLAGNAQVWTGQLAKNGPDAFLVESALGVIRPHGTGFNISGCIGNSCGSLSASVDSSGASASGSVSVGGATVTATASTEDLARQAEEFRQQVLQRLTEGQAQAERTGATAAQAAEDLAQSSEAALRVATEQAAREAEEARRRVTSRLEEARPQLEQAAQTGADIAIDIALIATTPVSPGAGGAAAATESERLAGAGEALADEAAQRAAEEARDAEREAARRAAEAEVFAERQAKRAEENAGKPTAPVPGVGAAPIPMPNPPPDDIQENVQAGADSAVQAGRTILDGAIDAGGAAAGTAAAQSEKALRAIEELRSAERDFARGVTDLKNSLDGMTNLSETEKQRVRDTLDEWSRLVGEEVARKIAEVTRNPNAQIAITTLQIMGVIVATLAAVLLVGVVGVSLATLAILSVVAHTAMTNPSVFDGVPASVIAQARRGPDQAAEAMRGLLAAMVEHGRLGADEARRFVEAMGQGTLDTSNEANAQIRKLMQALNDSKAVDKRHDAGEAQGSRNDGNQTAQGDTGRTEPASPAQVVVWDGSVEIAGRIVRKGELLRAMSNGQLVSGTDSAAPVNNAPRPDLVEVAANLFGAAEAIPPGLYVWVRDGVLTLGRGGRTVEVAVGSAAVATPDRLALLDHVPNFMRFDDTPVPSQGGQRFPEVFRAADGSLMGSCTVR